MSFDGTRPVGLPTSTNLSSAPMSAQTRARGSVSGTELTKLADLHRSGVLDDQEYALAKAKVLGIPAPAKPLAAVASAVAMPVTAAADVPVVTGTFMPADVCWTASNHSNRAMLSNRAVRVEPC